MANKYCNGDFFNADGLRYYHCLQDGTLYQARALQDGDKCANCGRIIGESSEHGTLSVQIIRYVDMPFSGGATLRITLPGRNCHKPQLLKEHHDGQA